MFNVSNSLWGYISNGVTNIVAASQGNTVAFKGITRSNSSQALLRSGGITTSGSITSASENTNKFVVEYFIPTLNDQERLYGNSD